jgi:Tfp pilus assembly protein PilF
MVSLILLAIFGFSASFYQQFYIPKLIAFYFMASACLILIWIRQPLKLPGAKPLVFIASFVLAGAVFGVSSKSPLTGFTQWSFYLGACLLYIAFLQLKHPDTERIFKVLFFAALAQLVLVILQQLGANNVLPQALIGEHERLFGTVGNQEFLSTLLGAGFFIGLHLYETNKDRNKRILILIACAGLFMGLVLAQNKGALLFIGLYFLWKRFPGYKLMLAFAMLALVLAVFMFPVSIKGRVLLWMVAAVMYAQHFATGVGFLQFENSYMDVVRELFGRHPLLSEMFGSYPAMTMDAHNIFLQFGTELGTTGLLLSLIFAGHVLRIANANRNYLGAALLFLLFKSLYTVVLASITGMIVFMLLLASLSPKRNIEFAGARRYSAMAAAPAVAVLFAVATWLSLSDYYYQQGVRALFMGRSEQAVSELNRALMFNRENSDAHLALAHVSYLQHDYAGMDHQIQNALRFRKNKDTYKVAANMYYYAKQYDEAFELYQHLHATFPQHLTSLTKLACIYMLRRDYEKAYAMAQQVLRTVPRKEAESDERNLRIARQIVIDSHPHLFPLIQ